MMGTSLLSMPWALERVCKFVGEILLISLLDCYFFYLVSLVVTLGRLTFY